MRGISILKTIMSLYLFFAGQHQPGSKKTFFQAQDFLEEFRFI